MDGKIYITEDEYQSLTIKVPKYYEIDIDKVDSVVDLFILLKAMFPSNLYIDDTSPYYEDLKHLKKDEE